MRVRAGEALFFNSFYAQQESKPANVIFYLSDDQDLLDYGVYGNPKVETPEPAFTSREST